MASDGSDKQQQFPPQKQETQPGKEHQMDPKPECFNQDFTPSNKLKVCVLYLFISLIISTSYLFLLSQETPATLYFRVPVESRCLCHKKLYIFINRNRAIRHVGPI